MSGLDEKAVLAACEAYHADLPTHDYPSRWAMEQAISAYLAAATPAYVGEEPVHKWTGNGPGVRGADNCQHVNAAGEQCGRWYEDAETVTCRNAIPSTPSTVVQTISGETVAGVPVLGWMWEVDAPLAGTTRQTAYHWSTPPSNVNVTRLVDATALERVVRERDEALEENTRLRAALAQSDLPCVYCTLPKDEWAKCASGFPGCGRADDAMGCPELGASTRAESAEAKLAEARKVIEPFAAEAPYWQGFGDYQQITHRAHGLEAGHLRAARRFLEETK